MSKGFGSDWMGALLSPGERSETDKLKAQVERAHSELSALADMLGGSARASYLAGRAAERAEAMGERAADEVSRRARQAAGVAREHPVSGGLGALVVIGLIALLLSRR